MQSIKKKNAAKAQPRGFFASFLMEREAQKKAETENEARTVANETAQSATDIAEKLRTLSFSPEWSRLSRDILEEKTDPNQLGCNMERIARTLAARLENQEPSAQIDLRPMDAQLNVLTDRFVTAVQDGYNSEAYVALDALNRGIDVIRNRVPSEDPEFAKQYIEENAAYLKRWVHLAESARTMDQIRENVNRQQRDYDIEEAALEEERAALKEKMKQDAKTARAIHVIYSHETPEERMRWSKEIREVYNFMLDRRMKDVNLLLKRYLVDQEKHHLEAQKAQVNTMKNGLLSLKVVRNKNEMNHFHDSVAEMFKQMADYDVQLDTMLKTMDSVEAQILQLEEAPGNLRAKEEVCDQTERFIKELKEEQDNELLDLKEAASLEEMFGIRSDEEQARLKQQLQEEKKQREEQKLQQKQNTNENSDLLYNE